VVMRADWLSAIAERQRHLFNENLESGIYLGGSRHATAARKLAKVLPGSGWRSSQVMAMGRSSQWLT
jgi:hypothetical protein